jgi:protein-S-isoprenylcysteine O-methyltransferase Ste14
MGTAGGLALAIWSRRTLGRNWSGRIGLKRGHELVRSGPYALARHPIYTGVIVALAGTALYIGEWRALLALPMFALGFWLKAAREEALLESEFGTEYRDYRCETGMLVPRVRPRRVHEPHESS